MAKYVLYVSAGIDEPVDVVLEDWDDDVFQRFENGELTELEKSHLQTAINEAVNLDFWIEKK